MTIDEQFDTLRGLYPGLPFDHVSINQMPGYEGRVSFRVCPCWDLRCGVDADKADNIVELVTDMLKHDRYRCVHVGGELTHIETGPTP